MHADSGLHVNYSSSELQGTERLSVSWLYVNQKQQNNIQLIWHIMLLLIKGTAKYRHDDDPKSWRDSAKQIGDQAIDLRPSLFLSLSPFLSVTLSLSLSLSCRYSPLFDLLKRATEPTA
jgi:hypothetical protein